MHHTVYVNRGGEPHPEEAIFSVKKRMISMLPTFEVFLTGNDSGTPDVSVTGGLLERKFSIITANGVVLADFSRDAFSLENIVLEKDTYFARIQPGVDIAFIVTLICIIEEVLED
eukprot:TRINITY_DN2518_c0_g1_i2.p1 TRINITY_DN2518_c0_g1~~TRINITY_DN2518_c0_g1_i2.p1  ORF type:complete len:115 (+),score=15.51 TRINITY_DN2518_c0_g1_i2:344-688(+)